MSRYRVEVDQTVTYHVVVEAGTVEDAIREVLDRVESPDGIGGIGSLMTDIEWHTPTASDAVEVEETA